ncbi:4Fe-4S dicluster domain-containing protein [Streptacidiphilus rugosus]|uniref:4Fe-4S dicluster domain-containing protein n=1 Tax=Streptacidiphilus rugosus TaxID=405783 RepID=UPI00055AAF1B|nr:4Fe-4S dicluster domain-containing protein [Streptacidiphilus rugosus]
MEPQSPTVTAGQPRELAQDDLQALFDALTARGWTVVGPTERDGAVVLAELTRADQLPHGVGVRLAPGGYRLRQREDRAAFAHSAGPQSWKNFLHPERARLWQADRDEEGGVTFTPDTEETAPAPRYALLGVHPCDLAAISRLDRVLTGGAFRDPVYGPRRDAAFVIAVACTDPGELCFCASVGTGPGLREDAPCDLAVHEIADRDGVRLMISAHSGRGAELLSDPRLPLREPHPELPELARRRTEDAAQRMGRELETEGLRDVLAGTLDSSVWDEVASRCLTCGNCTMVCPTCFCTTTEDTTDLTGEHAERWRRWDSCFDLDFSYVHGGSVRTSGRSRYRQWLTHKLGTWHDQFGSSGCVGCGRCIVWCPVGIDLTVEAARLREEAGP